MNTTSAPSGRYDHTAVWTDGSAGEMIVWGGCNGTSLSDGARYSPAGNVWTPLPSSGAPAARFYHTAVWTGAEMIVWGGYDGVNSLNSGGRWRGSRIAAPCKTGRARRTRCNARDQ